ncbi:MAG: hypothetical protein ACE5FL_06925 [Myxococcota bacterium]
MTRRRITRSAIPFAAAIALLLAVTVPASAEAPDAKTAVKTDLTPVSLLTREGEIDTADHRFSSNFHFHEKSGLAYTRHLKVSDKPIVFGLQGPVLRDQKALGLRFKIRF